MNRNIQAAAALALLSLGTTLHRNPREMLITRGEDGPFNGISLNPAPTWGYKRPSRAKLGLPPRERVISKKAKSRAKAKAARKQSVKSRRGQ